MARSKFASIIVTNHSSDEIRRELLKMSIKSLLKNTKYPYELIVVDNGGNKKISNFLLSLTEKGKIHTYIRNRDNMGFGYARNQGLRVCNGDYIVNADNDIEYSKGWLTKCVEVLELYPEQRIWVTPVLNITHDLPKWWSKKTLPVGDEFYRMNHRAGPNCYVMTKRSFEEVGEFLVHRIAGTKWLGVALSKGYLGVVVPGNLAADVGFRYKRDYKGATQFKLTLSNKEEIYFNRDEFKKTHPRVNFMTQRKFKSVPNEEL